MNAEPDLGLSNAAGVELSWHLEPGSAVNAEQIRMRRKGSGLYDEREEWRYAAVIYEKL